jgi:hypothetical protein
MRLPIVSTINAAPPPVTFHVHTAVDADANARLVARGPRVRFGDQSLPLGVGEIVGDVAFISHYFL